ncbi:hypothetical protein LTR65_008990 [Meristemomyces frigidus]
MAPAVQHNSSEDEYPSDDDDDDVFAPQADTPSRVPASSSTDITRPSLKRSRSSLDDDAQSAGKARRTTIHSSPGGPLRRAHHQKARKPSENSTYFKHV